MADDYLTAPEAADYACMPLADFLAQARRCGIVSFHLYRRADIRKLVAHGPADQGPPDVVHD